MKFHKASASPTRNPGIVMILQSCLGLLQGSLWSNTKSVTGFDTTLGNGVRPWVISQMYFLRTLG